MKRIVDPLANGGVPMFSDDFYANMQEQYVAEFIAIIQGLTGYSTGDGTGIILSGVVASGINTGAHTANFSAGYILLGGSIIFFPAQSGIDYRQYVFKTTSTFETRVFKDGSTHNAIETEVLALDSSPSGQWVYLDPTTTSAQGVLTSFYLSTIINSLANTPTWIDVATTVGFQNGWVNAGGSSQPLQYAINGTKLLVRGQVNSGTSSVVFICPIPAAATQRLPVAFYNNSNIALATVDINVLGYVSIAAADYTLSAALINAQFYIA